MPGSLKNKLLRHEIMPPPSAWNSISRRLDEEFSTSDSSLSSKLDNTSLPPPPFVWENISAGLNEPAEKPEKVIRFSFRRLAIAAVITGAIAVGALYFFTDKKSNINSTFSPPNDLAEKSDDRRNDANASVNPPVRNHESDTGSEEKVLLATNAPKHGYTRKKVNHSLSGNRKEYISSDMEEADMSPLQTVSALPPIAVSAPPLRDAKGNIIMDLSLISEPNQPYITITGPNGNQTRISNKFLNCLSFINGNIKVSDMDADAIECKTRFEEWRKKILSEAAFIPAANNFFDIFELKEMIQD